MVWETITCHSQIAEQRRALAPKMSGGDRQPEPLPTQDKEEQSSDNVPQLGALEEDDEFEEFPVQGLDI